MVSWRQEETFVMTGEEFDIRLANLAKAQEDLFKSQAETSQQLKELGRQIGGINNKFGSFAFF